MNWKDRGHGRFDALALRAVGGKYFVAWVERYYSETYCESREVRAYDVHYQTKVGGGLNNIHTTRVRTLEKAKALAELHHAKLGALLAAYGTERNVPSEAWGQFNAELRAWEKSTIETARQMS